MATTQSEITTVEALLRRERLIVLCGLIFITILSWCWLLNGAGMGMSVTAMTAWSFPPPIPPSMSHDWSLQYAIVMFLMWWIMMIAMMTPSAAPLILLYGHAYRHEQRLGRLHTAVTPTLFLAVGYLLAWMGFSILAAGLQWGLERAGLVHAMLMWSMSPVLSASLLVAAGVYQFTPLKKVCLEHCRSPAHFIAENFKPGKAGALRLGLKHGYFCLGCCWFLMGLLFVGGVMNLLWIAGLAILVLLEKIRPQGQRIARVAGVVMIIAGIWIFVRQPV